MIQGTGSLPAIVAPPATEGFSAVRFVWMLSDGTPAPSARSWPDGSHRFAPALKRLAKTFAASSLTWAPLDGSDTKAADAGEASIPASIVARPSAWGLRFISRPPVPSGARAAVFASLRTGPADGCGGLGVAVDCRYGPVAV